MGAARRPERLEPDWWVTQDTAQKPANLVTLGAYLRLWTAFMRARAFTALVLFGLQVFLHGWGLGGQPWLIGLSGMHLVATLMAWRWTPVERPQRVYDWRWLWTVGVDLVVFGLLQWFETGGLNYTPLFTLPVLLAAILGPRMLGLGGAAGATLWLLAEAWWSIQVVGTEATARFLQAGLTGTGFFLVALLAHQLALRLAREESLAMQGQQAARTQAEVNDLIAQGLSEGVVVLGAQGRPWHANPAALAMLGPAPGSNSAMTLSGLAQTSVWPALEHWTRQSLDAGEGLQAEVMAPLADGTPRRLFLRTQPTHSALNGSDRLCVVFLEDLREVEARMRTEKLASMGRMSAAVAHEIRNPLAAITQANALLQEDLSSAAQQKLSAIIAQNARRLARTVDDVLDLTRADIPQPPPRLSLDKTVRQTALDWAAQNRVGDALALDLQSGPALVAFEPEHLHRVLINLLDNAWRHATRQPGSIRLRSVAEADGLRLEVWSDSPPIEAGVQRHLFEPFFSSQSRSSGLGLYICRSLCERYGAQIAHRRTGPPDEDGNVFFIRFAPAVPGTGHIAQNQALP